MIQLLLGIPGAIVLFLTLFLSSVIVNVLQLIVAILFSPFTSTRTRMACYMYLANKWWDLFYFCLHSWSGCAVVWSGQPLPKGENVIMIGNHSGGLDFIPGIIVSSAAQVGCGNMITLMKKSLQYLPALGWIHYFQGSLFLNRSWEADEKRLSKKLTQIVQNDYPRPIWVGLYPEGTRITDKKRAESWKHSEEKGLPKLNNVLLPRYKGFNLVAQSLHESLDAVYDITIGYVNGPPYGIHALTQGRFRTRAVNLHVRRFPLSEVPSDEEGLKKWLLQVFVEKDALLQHFKEHGSFPGQVNSNPTNVGSLTTLATAWTLFLIGLFYLFVTSSPNVNLALVAIAFYNCVRGFIYGSAANRKAMVPSTSSSTGGSVNKTSTSSSSSVSTNSSSSTPTLKKLIGDSPVTVVKTRSVETTPVQNSQAHPQTVPLSDFRSRPLSAVSTPVPASPMVRPSIHSSMPTPQTHNALGSSLLRELDFPVDHSHDFDDLSEDGNVHPFPSSSFIPAPVRIRKLPIVSEDLQPYLDPFTSGPSPVRHPLQNLDHHMYAHSSLNYQSFPADLQLAEDEATQLELAQLLAEEHQLQDVFRESDHLLNRLTPIRQRLYEAEQDFS